MADGVTVQGPDGKTYQFPTGTTKEAAIGYFKTKGIGVAPPPPPATAPPAKQEPMLERHRMIPGPGGGFPQDYKMTEAQAAEGQKTVLGTLGGVAGGAAAGGAAAAPAAGKMLPWLIRALAGASGVGIGSGVGEFAGGAKPKEALEGAAKTTAETMALEGAGKAVGEVGGKLLSKVDPLQNINKLLGVSARDLVPGKTPTSLDEFAANPARGALKAGLDESRLSKMDVFERNSAIMQAKDAAGKQLDTALQIATQQGKTVDLQPVIERTFKGILDPKVGKQAENAVLTVLKENGVADPSKVTPVQAKKIIEQLSEYTGVKDIAEPLGKGIKEAIKKAVPELGPLNQNYWDLKNASQGTQKMLKQFGAKAPENKLRKMFIEHAVKGAGLTGGGTLAYEAIHQHKSTPVP